MGFFKNVKDTVVCGTFGMAHATRAHVASAVAVAEFLSTAPFLALAKDELSAEELQHLFEAMNSEDIEKAVAARTAALFVGTFDKNGCRDLGLLK